MRYAGLGAVSLPAQEETLVKAARGLSKGIGTAFQADRRRTNHSSYSRIRDDQSGLI